MDGKEICKFCGLKFGSKSVLKVHYSIVHQGGEQINKSDSIQGIPPEKKNHEGARHRRKPLGRSVRIYQN
jgi:hypothetical protein